MTDKETLKLALEALEEHHYGVAQIIIREALAQPEQIMQDSTCSTTLRLQGKPYPRTCKKCGLGFCISQPTAQPQPEQESVAMADYMALMKKYVALKAAQPQQEPVGKFAKFSDGIWREVTDGSAGVPLYTTPPQRNPLSDEEALEIARTFGAQPWPPGSCVAFARAVEAAHGIKETEK